MARPRRARLECAMSWMNRKVRGHPIMPRVTVQPVDFYCRAQVAVESFEARARIINASLDLTFPTLSILHLIDLLRDAEKNAATLLERKKVQSNEHPFVLLENNGITSKEDYDKAPVVEGQFTRDVRGLKHYKITGHQVIPLERSLEFLDCKGSKGAAYAIEEIAEKGPVTGWFVPWTSFSESTYNIYSTPKKPKQENVRLRPHALLLYGFGSRGRTSVFAQQNSWGTHYHKGGRGLIRCKEFVHVLIPTVERNWED